LSDWQVKLVRRYNIFQAVVLSFFSADFYRAVALRWRGIGFWYLFLLILAVTLPGAVRFWVNTAQVDRAMLEPVTKQVPRIEIKDGAATVAAPQPILIKDPQTGATVVIIDTTGKTNLDKVERGFLLTRTSIVFKEPNKRQEIQLKDLEPFLGNPALIDRLWVEDTIFWWIDLVNVLFVPLVVTFSFIYRFIELLILGLIGLLLASARKPALAYSQLLRIAAMSMTPMILINAVYEQLMPAHGLWCLWWIICIAVPLAYLSFGIRSAHDMPGAIDEQLDHENTGDDDDFGYERRQQ